MPKVLAYIEHRLKDGFYNESKNGLIVSIVKFSAQVSEKEEKKENKINIIGANPLGSKVFSVLNATEGVTVNPTSLKLNFQHGGDLHLAIDKLGNYRFWIPFDGEIKTLTILPLSVRFFFDIDSVDSSTFVNYSTMRRTKRFNM